VRANKDLFIQKSILHFVKDVFNFSAFLVNTFHFVEGKSLSLALSIFLL